MTTKPLGNSDLHITPIGLGAWAMGGDGAFGWGPQDDAESIAVRSKSKNFTPWHEMFSTENAVESVPAKSRSK